MTNLKTKLKRTSDKHRQHQTSYGTVTFHKEGGEWARVVLEEIKAGKLQNLVKYLIHRFKKSGKV